MAARQETKVMKPRNETASTRMRRPEFLFIIFVLINNFCHSVISIICDAVSLTLLDKWKVCEVVLMFPRSDEQYAA